MLKRTFTGLFLLGALLLILYLTSFSQFVFDGIVMLVTLLALIEIYKATKKLDYKPSGVSLLFLIIIIYPACYFYGYTGMLFAILLSFIIAFSIFIFDTKKTLKDFLINIFMIIYPVTLLAFAIVMSNKFGMIPTLFAISAALTSDTVAYYGGSLLGKKKIFPKISPKKTYAGSILGLLGGALGGLIIYFLFEVAKYPTNITFTFSSFTRYPYIFYIFIGFIMAIASEIGDLAASRIKREVGLKDFGTMLGSHGGIMDRIDSVLFTLPFMSIIMFFIS